jgi:hypothetical protein
MDDEVRKAAVGAIKEKAEALALERVHIRNEIADLDRRLRRNEVALLDCRSAGRLFDTEIELPEELATARGVWVRRIMNDPPPGATPSFPKFQTPHHSSRPPLSQTMRTGPTGPQVSSTSSPPHLPPLPYAHEPTPQLSLGNASDQHYSIGEPTVREIALEQLKRAGNSGARSANIRQVVENILKKSVHDKTVGMTLYRLSKEGKVRRDGQTWFLAPDARNPGVDAPGSEDRNR